jgi:hypothetical protein
MVVRLHDGGTSGKQLAEPSNETTRNSDMCSTMKLLASAGLPLLAEEVEELALQVDLQTTD